MQTEQKILQGFKQLLENTKQLFSREATIPERQQAIEGEFKKWNQTLQEKESQKILERIFEKMSELVQDLPNEKTRDILKYRLHELEQIEIKIKRYVPIKDKDLQTSLEIARQIILNQGTEEKSKNVLPTTFAGLQEQFAELEQKSKQALAESKNYPRRKKKKYRQQALRRFGLATMGAILAFGNVLLALQAHLQVETSQASITAGAGCLTAAALKKIE